MNRKSVNMEAPSTNGGASLTFMYRGKVISRSKAEEMKRMGYRSRRVTRHKFLGVLIPENWHDMDQKTLDQIAYKQLGFFKLLLSHVKDDDPTDPSHLVGALNLLLSKTSSQFQKAVAGVMLDFISPGWREILGPERAGICAKRNDPQVREWRLQVLERDGHRCVECGGTEELNAHHILPWKDCPESRLVVSNGQTLCFPCHLEAHGGNFRG